MKYIVLDLEATCWRNRNLGLISEIIEIGALCINGQGKITSEFAKFVKPIRNPRLSPFCTELTSISQEDVDKAAIFPEVMDAFQAWIGMDKEEYLLCSWGFYDKKQFKMDCEFHQLDTTWLKPHISIKHQHQKIRNLKKPLGMKNALELEGFQLEGFHHRGIDDARNIAKIFLKYQSQWKA